MTTITSRWPTVLYALVDTLRARTGYRAPETGDPETEVLVLDGREWQMTADLGNEYVIVGGRFDDTTRSGAIAQDWGPIGARARDEEGAVLCQAVAQLGGVGFTTAGLAVNVPQDTWRSLTLGAFAIVGGVEDVLRLDPSLAITGVPHMECDLRVVEDPDRYFTPTGAVVAVTFSVRYKTRI